MRLHLSFIVFILLVLPHVYGIDLPAKIDNAIFNDNIRTVEMYRTGWKLSNPIITLNSTESLTFSFDDLNTNKTDYYYTIYHCNRNWEISPMGQNEYLPSFTDFPIVDYAHSRNTNINYINYMFQIPNDDVPIVLSGNYALVVFDRNTPNEPVIIWRFYVVEQQVKINARIRRALQDGPRGEHQELDLKIDYGNLRINNPNNEVKVVISQNNRTDNAITHLKPVFIHNGILDYENTNEAIFKGENEFRAFEIRNYKYPGQGVQDISYYEPLYHATLTPDFPRAQNQYNFYEEMNGNYFIEVFNREFAETDADYMLVHFSLAVNQPLMGGDVYVFGKLSNWQCTPQNRMSYNLDRRRYELTMLLKQGYYNYTYAYLDHHTNEVKAYNLEGSHFQTENDYYIYVYYGRLSDRQDRLIGYQRFNSLRNRNY